VLKRLFCLFAVPLAFACSGSSDDTTDDDGMPMTCQNLASKIDATGLSLNVPDREVSGCRYEAVDPETARCMEIEPDLTCLGQNEPLGTPLLVTFTGCVNSFGLEAQSNDLTITILREEDNGTPTDPGYDVNGTPGSQAEKTPGAVVGTFVSTAVPRETCSDIGHFEIANIPTETPLIVRVTDQQFVKEDRQYVDTYQYNVALRNSVIRMGPNPDSPLVADPTTYCPANTCYVVDDVNTVIEQTFTTVALTAGVSTIEGDDDLYDGVGQGHIAGEVQDCSNDDTVKNASIGISSMVRKLAYFNVDFPPSLGNLEDPKVEQTRSLTNADGLYAAIAVNTQDGGQPVDIAAAVTRSICGTDGVCKCENGMPNAAWTAADADGSEADTVVLGKRTIYVYPDSISIFTFDRLLYTK
jgi:hypothetical protein